MKTFQYISLFALILSISSISFAQDLKTETIPVAGNCGMCKSNIEKAAKSAGVTYASWSADSKSLEVKYAAGTTDAAKIQKAVAAVGYDTRDVKAADEAYDKLHGCCKYDRDAMQSEKAEAKCEMKEGKCVGMAKCIEKGCCKNEADCKAKGCCSADKVASTGTKAAGCGMASAGDKACCAAH